MGIKDYQSCQYVALVQSPGNLTGSHSLLSKNCYVSLKVPERRWEKSAPSRNNGSLSFQLCLISNDNTFWGVLHYIKES